jgi:hypothetical protein
VIVHAVAPAEGCDSKETDMEWTLRGYEVCLTVRRRRVKTRPLNEKPVEQPSALCARAEHRYLLASGCHCLLLTR